MEYYRISEVKNYSRKRTKGAWISRYLLWRPFSPYATWLFANLRVPSVLIVTLSAQGQLGFGLAGIMTEIALP